MTYTKKYLRKGFKLADIRRVATDERKNQMSRGKIMKSHFVFTIFLLPSMILLLLLAGCDQPNVNVNIGGDSTNPDEPVGVGCGLSADAENSDCYVDNTGLRHCSVVGGF